VSGALSFWLVADAAATLSMSRRDPAAIAGLARQRLSRLLFHVARNNAFYGRRLQAAQLQWADPILALDPYRALTALSPVSKAELRCAGTGVFDAGELREDWYSSASSGSTGEPFRVYYEPRAWATLKYLVKLRARAACGVRPTDRVALLDATPPSSRSTVPRWARRWTRISLLQPASTVAAELRGFAPDAVYGLPSALLEAGRYLLEQGEQLALRAVFTSGELLQQSARERLSTAFGAPVYDVYGTSETKEIAWECPAGGRHLNSDVVHVEAVDESGHSVPTGVEGDLVATLLVNRAMPLLRYRTGDRGSLLAETCSCGCPMPLLGVVTGRTADILTLRGGHRISPYALTCAIERIPGVLRYQVSQLDQATVRVRAILASAADRTTVTAQVRTALRFGVAPFLDADVEFVDQLPTGPRAKFRVVEPLG
jgi:phenylacetate-CoA ligase